MKSGFGSWIVLLAVLTGCSGGTGTRSAPATPEPVQMQGMANTVRVGDLLFGAQPSPEALLRLKADGYKTVLSTRGPDELSWDEKAMVDSLGMQFVSIPMAKPVTAITDDEVARFDDLMKHGKRPMVLHCGSGNRVAGLWAVWLAERDGMTPEAAVELAGKAGMKKLRPVVEARLGEGGD